MLDQRLVIAVLAGACAASSLAVSAAAEPVRVAMLPMVVHSSDGETGYLSDGLAVTLAARLEQAGGILVIRMTGNDRTTATPAVAIEAARATGSEYVVFGSFTQFGSGASLDVQCARVETGDRGETPKSRRVFVQSGDLSEIIPKLDDLAERIVKYVRGDEQPEAPSPTSSPAGSDLGDLRRRVSELERVVSDLRASRKPAPEQAPAAGPE